MIPDSSSPYWANIERMESCCFVSFETEFISEELCMKIVVEVSDADE